MDLTARTALITGASRGIGKAIALELATRGADIGINYHSNKDEAEKVAKEVEKTGRKALLLPASIADQDQVENMFTTFLGKFGKLDIVVCNAGIVCDKMFLRMKLEDFTTVINTNLIGTFLVLKQAGTHMYRNKYGRVVTISSVSALTGNIGQANYTASKAGIIALTKTFAREVARRDITANVVAPGLIESDMSAQIAPEMTEKILTLIPKGRMGSGRDIAGLVAFLASSEAAYITGQVFSVNGGMLM